MSRSPFPSRALLAALVLATAATSGCSWFRRGDDLYAQSAENRPLEVPPELDAATTASAGTAGGSVTASGVRQAAAAAQQQAAIGFSAQGSREDVYARVGEALGAIDGVAITSRAQLLGAYDVTYAGASFLVRVTPAESGVQVSAVDPRGLPATGDAPRKLIDALRAAVVR